MRLAFSEDETPPMQTAEGCAAFEISAGQDVFITVSGGSLLLPDLSGVTTFAGQSGPAPDGATVYVSLYGCESSAPISMVISDSEGTVLSSYRMDYLTDADIWQISLIKQ